VLARPRARYAFIRSASEPHFRGRPLREYCHESENLNFRLFEVKIVAGLVAQRAEECITNRWRILQV